MTDRNYELFSRARAAIPGGVNSPVRAFRKVGGTPPFIARARGARLWDENGREYIDYLGSWGPLIAGHAHPRIVEALAKAAERGTSYGAPTRGEVELAEAIVQKVPSIDLVRLVNSGTEATMSAVRLARGFTGRDKIIKFDGCYHGHGDAFLIKAGSGALTFGAPDSPGVPRGTAADTLVADYNDAESVRKLLEANPGDVAAVIVEPVAGNVGCIPPLRGFLESLRNLCSTHGALLIFDEVITGFRVHPGGAQTLFGVIPDLTTLGKTIGGGLPVGAYGGRGDIMRRVSPDGEVYQAGTLSGNPLAVTAGLETLRILEEEGAYERLEKLAAGLEKGLAALIAGHNYPLRQNRVGSMFTLFFTENPVTDCRSAMNSDAELFARYFHHMLSEGIYLAPSPYECGFVSLAHTEQDIEKTVAAAERGLREVFG